MMLTSACQLSTSWARATHGRHLASKVPDLVWFRLVVAAALGASVFITWPLWNVRSQPPLLPAIELPQVSLAAALIGAAIGALVAPPAGATAVVVLAAYGMVADQTRMQPEFLSLPILLLGTLPSAAARLIARTHLISLWFYAGLHKLLSPGFLTDTGPRLLREAPVPLPEGLLTVGPVGIAAVEIATAILALAPATRRIASWLAFGVHSGILIALGPWGEARNIAIWPWNVALAVGGFALIAPWRTGLVADLRQARIAARVAAMALLVAPAGFYAGVVDAYPAHHLYSAATARATVYCPAGCDAEQDINATWHALNVPMPPEPRLFGAVFQATCSPGDTLRVEDPHPPPWVARGSRVETCRATGGLRAAHP